MSSSTIMVISFFAVAVLVPALYVLYCILCTSKNKYAIIAAFVIRGIFYIALLILILFVFGSYLHSCSSEEYDRGYEDGYEAGIHEGISRVKEDPFSYLDW